MNFKQPWVLCLVALFSISTFYACGGSDSEEGTSVTLSDNQTNAILSQIGSSMGLIIQGSFDTGSLSAANFVTRDIDKTDTCNVTGSTSADGTQEGVEDQSIDGSTDVEITFTDCEIEISGTESITINGTLSAEGNIDIEASGENDITGTSSVGFEGSLELSGEEFEEAQTCSTDIIVSVGAMGSTVDLTTTGTLCGNSVDYMETIDLENEDD